MVCFVRKGTTGSIVRQYLQVGEGLVDALLDVLGVEDFGGDEQILSFDGALLEQCLQSVADLSGVVSENG
jgi:hypothetical protein